MASSPNWAFDYTPSPAEWAAAFSGKVDVGGDASSNTVVPTGGTAPVTLAALAAGNFTSIAVGDGTGAPKLTAAGWYSPNGGVLSPQFSSAGLAYGTPPSGQINYNSIVCSADILDTTTNGAGGASLFYVGHNFGSPTGSGLTGGRTALNVLMQQVGAIGAGAGDAGTYAAAAFTAVGSYSAGGVSGANSGSLCAANPIAILRTGAGLYWNSLAGMEIDVIAQTGVGTSEKHGLSIVEGPGDVVAGTNSDYAFGINANASGGTPVGWTMGIAFGAYEGWWPIQHTGTLIGTKAAAIGGGPSYAAASGVDLSAVTFSAAAFRSAGFLVDGSGNATVAGLTVNAPSQSYTPVVLFGSTPPTAYVATGQWYRIGPVVIIEGSVHLTTVGAASGQLSISLPVTPAYSGPVNIIQNGNSGAGSVPSSPLAGFVSGNTILVDGAAAGGYSGLSSGNFANGSWVQFTAVVFVA